MMDTVGVVVVSYNSAEDLPECLDALAAAEGVGRVIVVDNLSRDASREVVRSADSRRIGLVEAEVNDGFAGGCNRGFGELASDFEYLAFLNPDVVVEKDCLQRCIEVLEESEDLAGVAPRLMRPDSRTVDSVGQVLKRANLEVRDIGYGAEPTKESLEPRNVISACGALAVFRTKALQAVADGHGPWAQHFFCFWEDFEIGWRLANAGWRIETCPGAVATHRRGAGAEEGRGPLRWRRTPELEACMLTNRWMTLIRHLHPLDLAPRFPLLLVWDVGMTKAGIIRRPSLIRHLKSRWPLVVSEWRGRHRFPKRRLRELS